MSSRGFPVTKSMRAERKAKAEQRQEEYNKLTLEQKLAKLPIDGARRQRARLTKQLEDAKVKQTNSNNKQ